MAAANVILLEVQPRAAATGARTTIRLAGGGADFPYRYGGNDWQPGITAIPSIVAALDYDGTDLGTGAVPQALALDWAATSKAALDALLNLHWQGAPFTLYLGVENAAGTMPATLITGTVLRGTITDSVLQLAMADPAAGMQRPIIIDTFAGTGGVEGPVEWEGRVKRRAWGYAYNVEGFAIDTANNVYSFTDPARPLNAISEVRDKGAVLTIQATIAWAGSIAATYAALQATAVTAGQCKIAPSIGMVKTWTRPAGILAADLLGETSAAAWGGVPSTPARLAEAIVAARAGPGFTGTTVADAVTLRNVPAGFLADDLQATIAQALDYVLGGSSLYWVLDAAGTIRIGEWTFGASQGAFASDHVDRIAYFPPIKTRKLGYKRNHRVMAAGDLAAILTYGDGTPLDNLQPAEAGANITLTHQAASITGQGTGATANNLTGLNATEGGKLGGIATGATVGATSGTNLYRSDGSTVMTQAEVRTAEGVAASIAGQAATATSSDFNAITGNKPEPLATIGDNLIYNGKAELQNTDGFSAAAVEGGAPTAFYYSGGSFYANKAATGNTFSITGKGIPTEPGKKYVLRINLNGSSATANGLFIRMNEKASGVRGDYITSANRTSLTELVTGNGPWPGGATQYNLQYTVPAGIYIFSPTLYDWTDGPTTIRWSNWTLTEVADFALDVGGGTKPENNADVTVTHTAAAISGQGSLATLNNVATTNIQDNAVSVPVSTYNSGSITWVGAGWDALVTASITTTGGPVFVLGQFEYNPNFARVFADGAEPLYRLIRTTSGADTELIPAMNWIRTINSIDFINSTYDFKPSGTNTVMYKDTPASGTHTYTLQFQPNGGAGSLAARKRVLMLLEMKK